MQVDETECWLNFALIACNVKNIFIMRQRGTNSMANQVKTPIQNYFEKVFYENLTFEIPPGLYLQARTESLKV
jgi:hypothetical protein